jgi:hypothetical protein
MRVRFSAPRRRRGLLPGNRFHTFNSHRAELDAVARLARAHGRKIGSRSCKRRETGHGEWPTSDISRRDPGVKGSAGKVKSRQKTRDE